MSARLVHTGGMFWPIFSFIVASKALVLALYGFFQGVPGAKVYGFLGLALSIWAGCYGFELLSPSLAETLWWVRLEYVGVVAAPPLVLLLVLRHTQVRLSSAAATALTLALFAVPAFSLLAVLTNARHGLFWRTVAVAPGGLHPLEATYGPLFWVHTGYSYGLLLTGFFVLVWRALGGMSRRRQAVALLGGLLLPWFFNLAYVLRPSLIIDLTPLGFGLALPLWGLALFGLREPDPLPSARAQVFETMSDGVVVVGRKGEVVDVNPAAEALLGRTRAEVVGAGFAEVFGALPGVTPWAEGAEKEALELRFNERDLLLHHSQLSTGRGAERVLILQDVTERRRHEREVTRLAHTDALTGLFNRRYLFEVGEKRLREAQRGGEPAWLFYLDLDRFKGVNDRFGHAAGDKLLADVAACLKRAVRNEDTLVRLGGDEFALLATGGDRAVARELAERLLESVGRSYGVGDTFVKLGASLGIACAPEHGSSVHDLLRLADLAMVAVKRGGSRDPFYHPSLGTAQRERLQLEAALRYAITAQDFELAFQPVVSLLTGERVGTESLLRWPKAGTPPGSFVPLAETLGLVAELDAFALERALTTPPQGGWLSVNLSPKSLEDGFWQGRFETLLARYSLPPGGLLLEITESVLLEPATAAVLLSLRERGVRLAVDDFGTGYSSLALLETLPADLIKLDRSFAQGVVSSPRKAALVRSVLALARSLDLPVVAEGVETNEQLEWFKSEGCPYAQGFLFGRPTVRAVMSD